MAKSAIKEERKIKVKKYIEKGRLWQSKDRITMCIGYVIEKFDCDCSVKCSQLVDIKHFKCVKAGLTTLESPFPVS
jgi:hypothetical protein